MRNEWVLVSMVLACWALGSSFFAVYYWMRYVDVTNKIGDALILVNLGIDYGNGSRAWQNDTRALAGQTLFDVTKQVANVTYQVGIFGTEILSINDVGKKDSFSWTYWIWNSTNSLWSIVWESVDKHVMANGETLMWYYHNDFNPPP